jgi:hypothetical protein
VVGLYPQDSNILTAPKCTGLASHCHRKWSAHSSLRNGLLGSVDHCAERIVAYSEKADVHWFPTDVLRVLRGPQGRLLLPAAPDCETFVRSVGELRSRGRVPQ